MRVGLSLTVALFLFVVPRVCSAYTFIEAGFESNILVEKDRVYFSQSDGSLTVLQLSTGEVLRRDRSQNFAGTFSSTASGIVVVGYGFAALVDQNSLKVLWRVEPAYNSIVTSNLVISDDGNGLVQCRDLATGKSNWSFNLSGALQLIVEGEQVFVNRAGMFEATDPTVVALDTKTGRELFRKVPPAKIYWEKLFCEGTNIYVEKCSFSGKRWNYKLEEMLVWDVRGKEIRSIPLSSEFDKSIHMSDMVFELEQKKFWKGQVYPKSENLGFEPLGRLKENRTLTNGNTEIYESEYDLGNKIAFLTRARKKSEFVQPSPEIEVRTSKGGWRAIVPYISGRDDIETVSQVQGKILIGTRLGRIECVDAETGVSQWLYYFPILRQTMSFSSHGMPPMMSQAAAVYREENAHPPKAAIQLVGGGPTQTRIISDPDPFDPFTRLPLYLAICWAGVCFPIGGLILIHNRKWVRDIIVRGAISLLCAAVAFGCYLLLGRVSLGSSIGLRIAILAGVVIAILDAARAFKKGSRFLPAIVIGMAIGIGVIVLPYFL